MQRRAFLWGLLGATAVIAVPELLLPPKSFFLPPAGGWAQKPLGDLWFEYAQRIRPVGVCVRLVHLTAWQPITKLAVGVREDFPGTVSLLLPSEICPDVERRMRHALIADQRMLLRPTIADFMPWDHS